MKCSDCTHNNKCELKEISVDLTGCEGASEQRKPNENEIQCITCDQIVLREEAFIDEKHNYGICFKCY